MQSVHRSSSNSRRRGAVLDASVWRSLIAWDRWLHGGHVSLHILLHTGTLGNALDTLHFGHFMLLIPGMHMRIQIAQHTAGTHRYRELKSHVIHTLSRTMHAHW